MSWLSAVCILVSGSGQFTSYASFTRASSQILLFIFINSGLWFWSIDLLRKLLCSLLSYLVNSPLMRAIQGLFPMILISYILSLIFHPSFASYSYFWSIDFLCKICSWQPVCRTTSLTFLTPWKSTEYNSSEHAEVEATVNR